MTIITRRFVAILVACALLLCGVCAGAEESDGWRISNDMTVDPALLHELLERLCPGWLLRYEVEKAGVLLDAIEPSLTVAGDGLQLDVDLNGKRTLSIGGMRTEDGVVIASTLFPSYVISVSTKKLTEITSDIAPMIARPKTGAKDAAPEAPEAAPASEAAPDSGETASSGAPEDDSDESLPVGEMSQYISVTEPESGAYQVNGVSYDVRRTYGLDCDGLVGLWNTLVDWVFANKGIAALIDIAKKAELGINVEQVRNLVPAESLPRLSATIYSSNTTADRYITATATSNNGEKIYAEAEFQVTEDAVTAKIAAPPLPLDIDFAARRDNGFRAELEVRGKEPLLYATFNSQEGSKGRLELVAGGSFLGTDYELVPYDASGEGLRLTASLYYTDERNPLFREEFALEPRGVLTLDFNNAEKTVVPITSLINVGNGYLVGFLMDVAFNGIGGLLDAATGVQTELKKLPEAPAPTAEPRA